MNTYLENYCHDLGINLIYRDDCSNILLTDVINGVSTIYAYHIFRDCPKKVAKAIIGFYTDENTEHYKILCDYANLYFSEKDYNILPANPQFTNLLTNQSNSPIIECESETSYEPRDKKHPLLHDNNLKEINILSITKKDFYGECEIISPDESIEVDEDNVIELDIIIEG